ncbi:MAG TPA: DUF5777 family beta-barrel protein [Prolixibacteraceae bacterium]|nr:DUF5777 family beta-barrel protein [Prolixibacteraceae bacterium]
MKKNILIIILFALISITSFAQQESTEATAVKEKDYPVNGTFESGCLIDAQTVVIPDAKTLEMVIQHKFGTIENGSSNLWGIYGSSNIRIGLNYVPVKNLQVGAGITKRNMMTDLNAKWSVLQQTRKNTIPVSVALYGNVGIDGRDISAFETGMVRVAYHTGLYNEFQFSDRLSYFSQLIIGRKFCKEFSLQAAVSFTHFNSVGVKFDHDKVGVHVNGRIKVSTQGSIIFNYDQPLKIKDISEQTEWTNPPKANLAIGYEVSTGSHAFQIYMGSSNSILPQDNIMWNQNDWQNKGLALGFTITRLWGF